jgi:hypothetical protein
MSAAKKSKTKFNFVTKASMLKHGEDYAQKHLGISWLEALKQRQAGCFEDTAAGYEIDRIRWLIERAEFPSKSRVNLGDHNLFQKVMFKIKRLLRNVRCKKLLSE